MDVKTLKEILLHIPDDWTVSLFNLDNGERTIVSITDVDTIVEGWFDINFTTNGESNGK